MSLEKLAAKLSIRPATLPVGASIKLHNAGKQLASGKVVFKFEN